MSEISSLSSSYVAGETDPLLKDLNERKQKFKRNVVSLAAELREVKRRLASQEQLYSIESLTRQRAEERAMDMEEEVRRTQKTLEEKCGELQATLSNLEKNLQDMENLRSKISATQETADANAASTHSARLQCLALLKELDVKDRLLIEQLRRASMLEEQLDLLQKDLVARESFQEKLRDEVLRIEHRILKAITEGRAKDESELKKVLDEISQKFSKLLTVKDEEISRLKNDIKNLSANWELKNKDFESELEKQRIIDQELRKRVLKLEFCIQEACTQTRKLRKIGDQRYETMKDLEQQLAMERRKEASNTAKQKFWESSTFKIILPMSILILVVVKSC